MPEKKLTGQVKMQAKESLASTSLATALCLFKVDSGGDLLPPEGLGRLNTLLILVLTSIF